MTLTDEQIQDYVDGYGMRCPYCLSTDLVSYQWEENDMGAEQHVKCNECGKVWVEDHSLVLTFIREEEPEEDEEDDSMDGDATSALASAGFGTDEDYGG